MILGIKARDALKAANEHLSKSFGLLDSKTAASVQDENDSKTAAPVQDENVECDFSSFRAEFVGT